ncbi:MAG: hypothetical protein ACTTKL_06555 [Treponema sp.]
MLRVNVTLNNDLLLRLKEKIEMFGKQQGAAKAMPNTAAAFNESAHFIQGMWRNWAMGGSIAGAEDIKTPSANLASSIRIYHIGDFHLDIGTDSAEMARIQEGQDELDMKKTHPYGKKSRVSKKGVPYLIVPFRWGTPNQKGGARAHFGNTVPAAVYAAMKKAAFKQSAKTGEIKIEKNYHGEDIARPSYDWGDRFNSADLQDDENSVPQNAEGMVKMKSNTHSKYLTFRVISADSPANSWKRKAVPANNVIGALENSCRDAVNAIIERGVKADMELE